jgi:hypothetical protein
MIVTPNACSVFQGTSDLFPHGLIAARGLEHPAAHLMWEPRATFKAPDSRPLQIRARWERRALAVVEQLSWGDPPRNRIVISKPHGLRAGAIIRGIDIEELHCRYRYAGKIPEHMGQYAEVITSDIANASRSHRPAYPRARHQDRPQCNAQHPGDVLRPLP